VSGRVSGWLRSAVVESLRPVEFGVSRRVCGSRRRAPRSRRIVVHRFRRGSIMERDPLEV